MYAVDFEYDGRFLSQYGFVICQFDRDGADDTVSAGSNITFDKVARHYGKTYTLTSTHYDECITATFSICKSPCRYEELEMTNDQYRDLMRWLNRREFKKFQIIDPDNTGRESCYFYGSFNVDKILSGGKLIGLKLTLETNAPFGYGQTQTTTWEMSANESRVLSDVSDEIVYIYPDIRVTTKASGTLTIYNELENCTTVVNNCTSGETISISGTTHIIESTVGTHKIYDDFNFEYLRIGNLLNNRSNKITVSLPCTLTISYTPVIKDTPDD